MLLSLRYAVGWLVEEHPDLAGHLDQTVRTGTYCSDQADLVGAGRVGAGLRKQLEPAPVGQLASDCWLEPAVVGARAGLRSFLARAGRGGCSGFPFVARAGPERQRGRVETR